MRKFSELVIRFRILIIIIVMLLTVVFGYSLKDLRVNSDILSYLPQDNPLVVLFNEVGNKFGGNSLAMVALETEDIFNYETLSRINKITQRFKEMDKISYVMSLTDILDIKKIEGGLEVGKLIDKYDIPRNPEELKRLREYTLSKDMYRGSLVSEDGKVTVIIARVKEGIDKISIGRQMKKSVEQAKGKERLYYAGIPFQMTFLTDIIITDLGKLVPLVILLVIVTLYFSFRSVRGIFLPLSTVLISTVWALGIMSLMDIPLSLASNAVPVLLIAIGSAYGIHMLSKYNEDVHKKGDKIQGIKDALTEVGLPIFLAGLTTLIGFLAFLSSNLSTLREFGIFTGIGVLFAMIISVTFLPAVLSFLKVKKTKVSKKGIGVDWLTKVMDKLAKFVLNKEKLIVALSILLVLGFLITIHRLHREVNMIEYFEKETEIRQAEEMMEDKLGGSIPIQLLVKGDLKEPAVLKEIVRMEKFLEAQPDVHNPQSIADLICEMNRVMNDRYTIPETREGVANLWFFIEGNEVLDQLINSEATEGLIQANLGSVNTKKLIRVVSSVGDYLKNKLKTDLLKVKISLASPELVEVLKEERAERILSKIEWDILRRDAESKIPAAELKKVITAGILPRQERFDDAFIETVSEKISDYFHSDEADPQIESEKVITKIVNEVGKRLSESVPAQEALVAILRENIPKDLYLGESEILGYAAESIAAIISEERKWVRVNQLIQNLEPLLPQSLSDNEDFLEDLRNDLWEINEDLLALDDSRYPDLFKEISAGEEDRVQLAVKQTGMPIIYTDIDRRIMTSQALSLFIAISLVFILLSFRLRSLLGGLISISPIVLTILVNFTLMAALNIPLDVVTVLIGSVVVGIGIDYTIHFISRFKVEFARDKTELEALSKTLETTGKAIVINAFSVMMGFLALTLGSIVPMQRFGYLIAFTMVISALGAITLLPALILISKARFIGDFSRFKAYALNRFNKIKGGKL